MISVTNNYCHNSHHSKHHSYHVINPSILIITLHCYLYSIYLLTPCHPKDHFDSLNFIPITYFMSIHYSLSHTLTTYFHLNYHCYGDHFLSTITTTVHKDYNRFIINDSILIIVISILPTRNIIPILY